MKIFSKTILTALLTIAGGLLSSAYADNLSMAPVTAAPGGTTELVFSLGNDSPYYGFQADIVLPAGLTAVAGQNGKPAVTLSPRFDNSYTAYSNTLDNGKVRVGTFSSSHTAISGISGELFRVSVKADNTFAGGVINVTDIKFIDSADRDVAMPSMTMPVTVAVATDNSRVYIDDFSIVRGDTKVVSVMLENTTAFTAFQTDITLPSSLTLVEGSIALADRDSGHTLDYKTVGNVTRVTCYSGNNAVLAGNSGAVLTFSVKAGDVVTNGQITLTNNVFTTSDLKEYKLENSTANVSVVNQGVTEVQLNKSSLTLYVGQEETLSATVLPENAFNKALNWNSSSAGVATVDESGKVKAISLGETTVQVTSADNPAAFATCVVKVVPTPLSGVTVTAAGSTTLRDGNTVQLNTVLSPDDATKPVTVTWTSSDNASATVDVNGLVTAHSKTGVVTITAKANNSAGNEVSGSIQITVEATPATEIQLNTYAISLQATKTYTLQATVLPVTTTNKAVTWSSDKPEIATVGNDGVVTAIAVGEAKIKATCGDASATCVVTVAATPASEVVLNKYELNLLVKQSEKLTASVNPPTTTDKTVTWASDNAAVATVGADGTVTAVTAGTANITATCGSVSATCAVTVRALSSDSNVTVTPGSGTTQGDDEGTPGDKTANGGYLNGNDLLLRVNQTAAISLEVTAESDVQPVFVWTLANGGNAVVSMTVSSTDTKTATFKGLAIGETTYSVKLANTDTELISGTVKVIGENPVMALSLTPQEVSMAKNALPVQITAAINPENASVKTLDWKSSDTTVATVDAQGKVTPVGIGHATITATTTDGTELSATSAVTVTAPVDDNFGFEFDGSVSGGAAEGISLYPGQSYTFVPKARDGYVLPEIKNWSSSDAQTVSVDQTGKVTALKVGEATVTATAEVNGSEVTATCKVTVKALSSDSNVTVTPGSGTTQGDDEGTPGDKTANGGYLNGNDLLLRVNQTAAISLEVTAESDVQPVFVWTLANGGNAVVSMTVSSTDTKTATFKGLAIGETTYSVKLANTDTELISGTVKVIGENPVMALSLTPQEVSMAKNALPVQITAAINPENASVKTLDWKSSDTTVATVDAQGKVTPVGVGQATITATTTDGTELSATSAVTVTAPVDDSFGFEFDGSVSGGAADGISLYLGQSYTFVPKARDGYVLPEIKNWSSSDAQTVSVDQTGKVTALKVGEATVTATAEVNGSEVTATCKVTVLPIAASTVTISADEATLLVGQTFTLTAEVEPDNTTYPEVIWASDNTAVATVGTDGAVTAVSVGTANITATCGEVSATCVVTVKSLSSDGDVTVTPGAGTTEGDENNSDADNTANGGSLNGNDLTLRIGQTAEIALSVNGTFTVAPTFEWTLADGGEDFVTMVIADDTMSASFTGVEQGVTTYVITRTGDDVVLVSGKILVLDENGVGVNSVAVDSDDVVRVYNLQGMRMNVSDRQGLRSLPRGVYIVNGKKELVR